MPAAEAELARELGDGQRARCLGEPPRCPRQFARGRTRLQGPQQHLVDDVETLRPRSARVQAFQELGRERTDEVANIYDRAGEGRRRQPEQAPDTERQQADVYAFEQRRASYERGPIV